MICFVYVYENLEGKCKKSFIYLRNSHGCGIITCQGCGRTEEIIGYVHVFDKPLPYSEGYQCQSCGMFHEVDFLGKKSVSTDIYSCGGKLSIGKPAFCPKCKARDIAIIVYL